MLYQALMYMQMEQPDMICMTIDLFDLDNMGWHILFVMLHQLLIHNNQRMLLCKMFCLWMLGMSRRRKVFFLGLLLC